MLKLAINNEGVSSKNSAPPLYIDICENGIWYRKKFDTFLNAYMIIDIKENKENLKNNA